MSQVPQAIGVGDQRRKRVPIWVLLVALAFEYAAGAARGHAVRRAPVRLPWLAWRAGRRLFYWPWSFVIWSLKWGHAHTELFQWAYVIAMVGIAQLSVCTWSRTR